MIRAILLSVLFALCSGASVHKTENRIIGGSDVGDMRDVHFVVSLRHKGTHICGGAVISTQHVLTAAECVYPLLLVDLTVHSGSKYLTGNTVLHQVIAYYVNPYYLAHKKNYNIAIVLVNKKFDLFDPVKLSDENMGPGRTVMTYGWGVTSDSDGDAPLSPVLQQVEMTVVESAKCAAAYTGRPELTIDEKVSCTEVKEKGICRGDYGGPLINMATGTPQLLGVSFQSSLYCVNERYPDVFFLVAPVHTWIKGITGA